MPNKQAKKMEWLTLFKNYEDVAPTSFVFTHNMVEKTFTSIWNCYREKYQNYIKETEENDMYMPEMREFILTLNPKIAKKYRKATGDYNKQMRIVWVKGFDDKRYWYAGRGGILHCQSNIDTKNEEKNYEICSCPVEIKQICSDIDLILKKHAF